MRAHLAFASSFMFFLLSCGQSSSTTSSGSGGAASTTTTQTSGQTGSGGATTATSGATTATSGATTGVTSSTTTVTASASTSSSATTSSTSATSSSTSSGGGGCTTNADCGALPMECAFLIADKCTAKGECVMRPAGSPCFAIILREGCGCNGQTVMWHDGCHPDEPMGYSPAPITHTGACP